MLVTINGQPIDYTLEAEQVLGQVVDGIEKALNDARMVVTSLRLGDRELATEAETAWSQIRLDSVERLDITALPLADLEGEQLALIGQYLAQLEALVDKRGALPEGALEGFAAATAMARLRLDLGAGSPTAAALGELEHLLRPGSPETPATWPEGIRRRALDAIAGLRQAVSARLVAVDSPSDALRAAAGALDGCSRDLAEVSLMLQTGRQDKAMGHITSFAALLQSTLRSLARLGDSHPNDPPLLIDGRPFGEYADDMNSVLRQAVEALEARDTVLLGDLLEYEVAPRLQGLSAFLARREA